MREAFSPAALRPGTTIAFDLPIMQFPDGGTLSLPVLAVTGREAGPTLALLAGVHGDEYEGVRAIPQIVQALDGQALRGRLLAVPVCNVPAFRSATRSSPIDGLNLARVFPGDPEGTVTQRIAHALTTQIIAPADLLIDLHSAGSYYAMPTLVGYCYADTPLGRASAAAAMAFGCEVVWGHPPDPTTTGRSISAAEELGIPWVYTEAAGGARTRPEDVACYIEGVLNVMRHLNMLDSRSSARPPRYHLVGSGNTDRLIRAGTSGYFVSYIELLQAVAAGEPLGAILDLSGTIIEQIAAPRAGRVMMLRGLPAVHAGEGLFLLSEDLAAPL